MEEEIKDLNYVFNEVPIYSKEIFNIFEIENNEYKLNREELVRFKKYVHSYNNKLITNCVWCDKEFSFDVRSDLFSANSNGSFSSNRAIDLSNNCSAEIYLYSDIITGRQPPYDIDFIKDRNYYISYSITCNNNKLHSYYMTLLVRIEKGKFIVRKVGQYPSMLSVKGFDFDKYKRQLKKYNAYEDYKNADLSMVNNFHAGAYTYLRRVYEKQLNFYVEKDNPKLSDNRTETKIRAVKGNFDPRIHEHLNNLYGILSIGIHELDEEESKDYYEYLKAMIDMQLQFEK